MMAFTELASTNPGETRQFLEETFGWKFDAVQMPTGSYLTFQNPKGTTVGIRTAQKSETLGGTNYVLVDDLDEAERRVRKKGGRSSFHIQISPAWAVSSGSRSHLAQ